MRSAFFPGAIVLAIAGIGSADPSSQSLFEQRILPILRSPDPSSCSDCHLSGVDLKQYIGKDAASTFAALRDQGLVDVEKPEDSELLRLIAREPAKATLVSARVRKQELAAFREWIVAAAGDPDLKAAPGGNPQLGPQIPDEVIAHTRQDHVLERFVDLVWSEVERCAACHSPLQNREQVEKHGEQISWIVPRDPAATLEVLLDHKLFDLEKPEQSLILLKPTNQIEHGGGIKLVAGDRTYTRFRTFIEDYARSKRGQYAQADELLALPDDVTRTTDIWFRIEKLPPAFVGKLLAVELFPEAVGGWAETPLAVGDRYIYPPSDSWQQHLSLVAPRGSARAQALAVEKPEIAKLLPKGRYLVKVSVDQSGRLGREFPTRPGPDEFVGQFEIDSAWPAGYGQMTVTSLPPDLKESR